MTAVTQLTKAMQGKAAAVRTAVARRRVALVFRFVAMAGLLGNVSYVFAADKPFAAPQTAEHVAATSAGGLLQVTLSLLLVLAAVFAAAWVMRRLRGFGSASSKAIQIIADAPLGTKERAVLLQVGEQQLLVGVTPGQVSLLHVLPEKVGALPPDPAQPTGTVSPSHDFKAILKRSLGL